MPFDARALKAKKGPLPLWGWLLLLLLAVGGWWVLRRRRTQGAPEVQVLGNVTPYGAVNAANSGQPSLATAPAASLDPGVLDSLVQLRGLEFAHATDLAQLTVTGRGQELDFQARMAEIAAAHPGATTGLQQPAMTTTGNAAQHTAVSFAWGGRTWQANDRKAFATYLSRRGGSIESWLAHHPTTAQQLGWR